MAEHMTDSMTDLEVRLAGIDALCNALGPAGAARFVALLGQNRGDYTAERHQWIESLTIDDIAASIYARRQREASPSPSKQPSES